ncbi:MAG: pyrophosphatase [Bacteroides sp.]|nr:pyrophosphatase [Bacteroides sp.]
MEQTAEGLRRAQTMVDRWIRSTGKGYFSELTNMVMLTEEVGELARLIGRIYGDQVAKEGDLRKSLGEELSDILMVTLCLANQTGVDIGQAFLDGMEKRERRDRKRFEA